MAAQKAPISSRLDTAPYAISEIESPPTGFSRIRTGEISGFWGRTISGFSRSGGRLTIIPASLDDSLLVNGRVNGRWVLNLEKDARASALVHDSADVSHWVRLTGTAELVREGDDGAVEDAEVRARRYGDDPEQFTGQHPRDLAPRSSPSTRAGRMILPRRDSGGAVSPNVRWAAGAKSAPGTGSEQGLAGARDNSEEGVRVFGRVGTLCCAAVEDDLELISRMRVGDDEAFVVLVGRYHDSMLRLARGYVPSAAVAEEVVQDTWMGVMRGIGGFEGRSSFRTWLFRILVNRASTTGVREQRTVPLGDMGPTVDASRFDASGHWISPPESWTDEVDGRISAAAAAPLLRAALDALPARQREVVTLRDVEGLTSREVCEVLDLTEGNQRVLLHRGRSQLRFALENDLGGFR